jgi:hypothetical protein
MKYFFPFVILLMISCNRPGSFHFSGKIEKDLDAMLKSGIHKASVMDSLVQNTEQQALEKIYKESIRQNYNWYTHYLDSFSGQPELPYHPNFGLTEEQYQALLNYRKDITLASTETGDIEIRNEKDIISFKASGKMSLLDKVRIDTRNNTVLYDNYLLNFSDTIHVNNENHGLKSTWDGYTWRFSEPRDMNMEDIRNTENLTARHYKLTVGHLNKTGKTIINFTAREMVNGDFITDINIPVIF